jgi:hypothetical protein
MFKYNIYWDERKYEAAPWLPHKKNLFFRISLKKLGIICNLNKEHSPLKREPIHKKTTYMSTKNIQAWIWKDENNVICCSNQWAIQIFLTCLKH